MFEQTFKNINAMLKILHLLGFESFLEKASVQYEVTPYANRRVAQTHQ